MDLSQSVQSMLLIALGAIPILTALSIGVSQKVMSEINQKIKSVIKFVIRVTIQRNQRRSDQAKVKTQRANFSKLPQNGKTENGKRPL
eukprot:5313605-Amphidinium_carterae.1